MSVYRVEKTSNFTIMSNRHLQDRREAYPIELVRERFEALTDQHMAQVMDRLNRQVNPISNIRDDLLTVLFRAAADGEDEHDQAV